jgi:uncharacterized damage-inducible protein DinB
MSDRSHYGAGGGFMTTDSCSRLVHYKRWADGGLYRVVSENLERLESPDQLVVLALLDHMHAVDRIFQHHLLGKPHGYDGPRSREPIQFAVLSDHVREVDDWYVGYIDALPERGIDESVAFAFTNGAPARMRRSDIVLHVALHGTYHRGNIGLLLQKSGVSPSGDRLTDFLDAGS